VISVPHASPTKRLRLDVRRVRSWRGIPRGHEGQALAWVPVHKLPEYAMPPADRPVVAALLHPDRYLVTPPPTGRGKRWLSALERALGGGVQRVQLRAPGFDPGVWPSLAEQAAEACRRAGVQVLVNGDIGLAKDLGVGVHLRGSQLAEFDARPLPAGVAVAGSCHDADELAAAARIGCDFVVLGPVSETSSHPGTPGIGWDAFAALRECCDLPIYAIGGLAPRDIATARAHGAQGIAAIRGLWPGTL
jgi:8-oxo-dGTP diphosphatase